MILVELSGVSKLLVFVEACALICYTTAQIGASVCSSLQR
jgi:hypothetical protein